MQTDSASALTSHIPAILAAVGALGTAAFGLVDTCKMLPYGGISHAGFKFIRNTIAKLTPEVPVFNGTGLSRESVLETLHSQWINGTATADQVNIAKSLIKLRLTPATAPDVARATGVDPAVLGAIAGNIIAGNPLTPQQTDVYGRFDLLLTTLLDQAYQGGDQRYRNAAKFTAVLVAVVLAVAGAYILKDTAVTITYPQAVLLGLIATPIAPIAKDLSTGITTAMQAIQSLKS
jgi:hypothetical protein